MEIDITAFLDGSANLMDYSASRAERGANAGTETWANAMARAATPPAMLDTPVKLDALRNHVRSMGFGDEVMTYPATECEALFLQLIAGDVRAVSEYNLDGGEDADWAGYEADEDCRGNNLFRAADGRIFYYLGD